MSEAYKASTKLAVVRTSSKAGHFKIVWVYKQRSDGWLLGGDDMTYPPYHDRWAWRAPHHVISVVDFNKSKNNDWNGIVPGTLVRFGDPFNDNTIGIVIARESAQYVILQSSTGQQIRRSWEQVCPVEDAEQES